MVHKILRNPAVLAATGKARSSLYSDISAGLFTKPVKIGPRAAGWPEPEVAALQAARIAGKTESEIRTLVRELEAQRSKGPQ
jgi:prophage regulatory protein